MTISDRMNNVNYRLLVYLLLIPILLFYTLCLTGCVSNSPGIPNIFAAKIEGRNSTVSTISAIRVNYFGICASISNKLFCQSSSGKTAGALLNSILNSNANVTSTTISAALVSLAFTIQSKIILYLLAAAGVVFFISLILLALLK
ncbi:uncharacterized protein BDZ99DRAFT_112734 [Mytilinidion resinicola]|uniref:Uncharacterized protein n=1 Tax=Mytilinidion resinicola TaxID=574789 RepID=A0A6A6Y959_9PEZI|nr:uncharacterized protein BDZ99DRAFT_112734 [Mytilinidion resinicola]KAF2805083.1 hypothetical protein BDZ99DRAFT_112734 [Mytilinidion resinicola]